MCGKSSFFIVLSHKQSRSTVCATARRVKVLPCAAFPLPCGHSLRPEACAEILWYTLTSTFRSSELYTAAGFLPPAMSLRFSFASVQGNNKLGLDQTFPSSNFAKEWTVNSLKSLLLSGCKIHLFQKNSSRIQIGCRHICHMWQGLCGGPTCVGGDRDGRSRGTGRVPVAALEPSRTVGACGQDCCIICSALASTQVVSVTLWATAARLLAACK